MRNAAGEPNRRGEPLHCERMGAGTDAISDGRASAVNGSRIGGGDVNLDRSSCRAGCVGSKAARFGACIGAWLATSIATLITFRRRSIDARPARGGETGTVSLEVELDELANLN